jgi:hypothetical protein
MKKLYFIFVAFMISQNLFAITKEWKGAISTDWANADKYLHQINLIQVTMKSF